jgi:hypothetical protein
MMKWTLRENGLKFDHPRNREENELFHGVINVRHANRRKT